MPTHLKPILWLACALLGATTISAEEITELGVVPESKTQVAALTGKPLSGEQIFDRSIPSLVFIVVKTSGGKLGMGSGFFATDDGLVVTNAHVVKGAQVIELTMHDDKSTSDVTLLAYDEKRDLAVLQGPTKGYPKVTLATRKPRVGSTVYAIGNPSGLSNTISKGLISGIRPGTAGETSAEMAKDASKENVSSYVIQHTAAISGGSSGGMLLAETGELIGVNTFGLTDINDAYFAASAADVDIVVSTARRMPLKAANKPTLGEQAKPRASNPAKPAQDKTANADAAGQEFNFKSLPQATVEQLTDAARNYAFIGYHVCNIELYNLAQDLGRQSLLNDQEQATLEYLRKKGTPLIYTISGKTAWNSMEQAMSVMKVATLKANILKVYANNTLLETDQGPLLINKTYPNAGIGDLIEITYTPQDPVDVELNGKTIKATRVNWCYTVKPMTAQSLGAIMARRKITDLLSVKINYEPGKRTIHQTRVGKGTEYTADYIPPKLSPQLTFTPISLYKSP